MTQTSLRRSLDATVTDADLHAVADWRNPDSHAAAPELGGPVMHNRHHPDCRNRDNVPPGTRLDYDHLFPLAKDCACQPHIWKGA